MLDGLGIDAWFVNVRVLIVFLVFLNWIKLEEFLVLVVGNCFIFLGYFVFIFVKIFFKIFFDNLGGILK